MPKRRKVTPTFRMNKREAEQYVRDYYRDHPSGQADYRAIMHYVGAKDSYSRKLISMALHTLSEQGSLQMVSHGVYAWVEPSELQEAKIRFYANGRAEIRLEDGAEVSIPGGRTLRALPDDLVLVRIRRDRKRGYVGEVERIIERAREKFVGLLQVEPGYAFVIPENRHMDVDFFVPLEDLNGGTDGDKVVVRLVAWPETAKSPIGRVEEVLGRSGEHEVEMHSILAEFGLPYEYPEEVTQAAKELPTDITPEEIAKRRDFRNITTFTIDPETAKDFDDAISFRELENGHYEVGIHIADVTHYVQPDSIIEEEAYNRATSVYLVDRTVPMLPEHLCNFLCSLRPNEDKLTFSVVVQMTPEARIKDVWIGRTIIHSTARFTYEQAQEMIKGSDGQFAKEIRTLNALAQLLRDKRFANGAIDFADEEVKFKLDEKGKPIDVIPQVHNESHQLIEEFMLIANRLVAEFVAKPAAGKKVRPFVFRIHDKPNPEKLLSLAQVVSKLGFQVDADPENMNSRGINRIIHEVAGRPEQHFVDILAVRSMAKAIYSTHNIGHYGLAFDYYSHFTSPIRRYPDMMAHRILAQVLEDKPSPGVSILEPQCEHSSAMERLAAEAERASIKYKQVEYMGARIGQIFEGTISGVLDFGFFVEVASNKCEGLVSIRELGDDHYEYIPDEFCLKGQNTHRVIRLGDSVKVEVARADLYMKRLDFRLVEHRGRKIVDHGNMPLNMYREDRRGGGKRESHKRRRHDPGTVRRGAGKGSGRRR